jgi:hypothetical protein
MKLCLLDLFLFQEVGVLVADLHESLVVLTVDEPAILVFTTSFGLVFMMGWIISRRYLAVDPSLLPSDSLQEQPVVLVILRLVVVSRIPFHLGKIELLDFHHFVSDSRRDRPCRDVSWIKHLPISRDQVHR